MVAMYRPSLASLFVVVASILSVTSAPVASEGALQKRTSGQGTFFEVGLGACGNTDVDSDSIVALAVSTYGSGEHCGQQVTITDPKNGNTATATVEDKCQACAAGDLDMSPSLFQQFEDPSVGRFDITWSFA